MVERTAGIDSNEDKKLSYCRGSARGAMLVNLCHGSQGMGVSKVSISKSNFQGQSRVLAMVPFDRPHTISYQCFIATMSLSCTVNEILFVLCMLGLDIADWCTKFDHSSFSRSKDVLGANQNLNGSCEWPDHAPISGLAFATINLPTKFKLSTSAHYKGMERNTKYRKWSGLMSLGVTQGHWKQCHSIERIQVPISFP